MSWLSSCVLVIALLSFVRTQGEAQTFTVTPRDTLLAQPLGTEFVFDVLVRNISASPVNISMTRIENQLLSGWQSALCIGQFCFAPSIDSVATTKSFGSNPIPAGDTMGVSLHVTALTTSGSSFVRITFRNLDQPTEAKTHRFRADAGASEVRGTAEHPEGFALAQNYPNPFNPCTIIGYRVSAPGARWVTLGVFDLLGREVAVLVNEPKPAGSHKVAFDGAGLAGGVYLYRLSSGSFTESRAMILLR